jgi:hypothetical protein
MRRNIRALLRVLRSNSQENRAQPPTGPRLLAANARAQPPTGTHSAGRERPRSTAHERLAGVQHRCGQVTVADRLQRLPARDAVDLGDDDLAL